MPSLCQPMSGPEQVNRNVQYYDYSAVDNTLAIIHKKELDLVNQGATLWNRLDYEGADDF